MATFYLLPPRECLEQSVAEFVGRIIPGLTVPPEICESLIESLQSTQPDSFFIHREDLPGHDPHAELCAGFGAESGDHVIEIGLAGSQRPATVRHGMIPFGMSERASAR